jgi:hypothetical protein
MGRYDVLLETQEREEALPKKLAPPERKTERAVKPPAGLKIEAKPNNKPVPLVPPVRDVRPVLPGLGTKRTMKQRHPFDIYQDQYETLQQLALEERMQGGVGSMSAMVRAALDAFIAKRKKDAA